VTASLPSFANLKNNLDWASLPLFDRTGWRRMPPDGVTAFGVLIIFIPIGSDTPKLASAFFVGF